MAYTYHSPIYQEADTVRVNEFISQSNQANFAGNYEEAIKFALRAHSIATAIDYMEGQAKAKTHLIDVYINREDFQRAIDSLNKAIDEFPQSKQMAQFYNLMGSTYGNMGQPFEAVKAFQTAMDYTDRLPLQDADRMKASLLHNLATEYEETGQQEKAYQNFLEAIEYAKTAKDSTMLTIAYNNLGMSYGNNDKLEKSLYYLEQSLEMAEARNLKLDIYRARQNMANTLRDMGRFEEALNNYEIAEQIIRELRPNTPPAIILHNQGNTLAQMGNYDEAEDLLLESLEMCENMGIQQGIYFNNHVLGRMYMEQNRSEEAIYRLNIAIDVANEFANIGLLQDSRELLYQALSMANRYEDAYRTLREFTATKDSLYNIEKERELAQLENQLELNRQSEINRLLQEKQEQQAQKLQSQRILIVAAVLIIILVLAILFIMRKTAREKEEILSELRVRKQELEKLNKAKDELFAIIAHDLRSPLTSMQGILELIKNNILSQGDMTTLIEELESSVQKNKEVMEDLLVWAKEQLSGVEMEITEVNIREVTEGVMSSQAFVANKKGVSLNQNIEKDLKIKADYNALKLILRNLISNSIKYSDKGDQVDVSVEMNTDSIILMVSDTGIGISDDIADKIFESKSFTNQGTNKEMGSGFGLSLSKDFVERMNGNIWFESEEGVGTTFYVELPKS
ncbi:tetratricopeptide repeat protein [Gracilimonas sp.]|uniref:tetratricopeptide repeat protein n=1 Tax=Gracilimonas sp. TaxID=1974203 RepID=UPI002871733D|nr:tetratricopeptide repeat-containing sensor histidine kinase [Gracilimonas sp.]